MSVQVEKLEHNMAKLTIEVEASKFDAAMKKAYNKKKGSFNLPGFRKGKVPMYIIEKEYGAGVFYEDAANELMPEAYAAALEESGLEVVSRPEVDVTQIGKGQNFIFTAEVAVKPEVKLGEYKAMEVEAIPTGALSLDIALGIGGVPRGRIIEVFGPESSGKTTFAQRLGLQLRINGIKPVTISVDNYFVERDQTPRNEKGEYDFEDINAIDIDLFNDQLLKLLNGEEVELPEFDFKVGTKRYNGNKVKMAEDEVLVIEGIHCLNDKLTEKIPQEQKYKIYISALTVLNMDSFNRISTTDTRLVRRIVRDNQFRGYTAQNTIATWDNVNKGEEKNI